MQYCASFCWIPRWIYTHLLLLGFPPTPLPSQPLDRLCSSFPLAVCLYMVAYVCPCCPLRISSYVMENVVNALCLTKRRHHKWKDNVKKNYYIYSCSDLCIDKKEAVIGLLHSPLVWLIQLNDGSLAYTLMNDLPINFLWATLLQSYS